MKRIDFFFDLSCPYAYLAHTQIERVAAQAGAELAWRPMLLGGVFRAIGAPDVPRMVAPKVENNLKDMRRWAEHWGAPLVMPATHPNRTVTALRCILSTESHEELVRASKALFSAYWARGEDVSSREVVASALAGAGLDAEQLLARAEEQRAKDKLRDETDAALRAGAFGAPSFFLTKDDGSQELIWGQDRFPLVLHALGAPQEPPIEASGAPDQTLEFYFDFSSPYAYLASTQVQALAKKHRAKLVYKPILLGALFKDIGTPQVPMMEMPEPKRAHAGRDLYRWAALYGAPFHFPSRFPMNTVKALRMVLEVEEAKRPSLVDAIYRAYWVEDRDINDDRELETIASALGHDGASLVRGTQDAAIKDALRRSTDAARDRGLCGLPSFDVRGHLFWGQDRMIFVERVLNGWRPSV